MVMLLEGMSGIAMKMSLEEVLMAMLSEDMSGIVMEMLFEEVVLGILLEMMQENLTQAPKCMLVSVWELL